MTNVEPRGFNLSAARWLALGAAAGAAIALAMAQLGVAGPWQITALVLALLALFATTSLAFDVHRREAALRYQSDLRERREEEINVLQVEIDRHTLLETELTNAKHAAESAVMAKGEFLATMSHEIRTPLNGIIPMLDLLSNSKLAPDQREVLDTAVASAQQLLRIVDDILDYSKLEADRLELETTGFNLRELLQSVITLMERSASTRNLHLVLQIDASVRLPVRGDPVRLRQILTNLISNAIKFTERGSITVTAKRLGETPTQHQLRFEVQDTGIGIDASTQEKLFQPFSQADASTTRIYGGTGLGLVISRRIVSLMDGRIGVDSTLGRGATFWFEIPLLKVQGDIKPGQEELRDGRVLLITTDTKLRSRISMLLPNWGQRVTGVENTHDALERLRQGHSQGEAWAFTTVLADLSSIRSTAVSLARNLERKQQYGDVRLIYLRGDDITSQELPTNCTIIPRSVDDADLRTALAASRDTSQATPTPTAVVPPAPARPSKPPRILLVEDNPVNLMVAQRLLQVMGADCETACNGKAALEKLESGSQYDLVLMDCQMPVLDGYSATRRWRELEHQHDATRRLPIVAMTANAMTGDRQKCIDAGMDDYLSKPVSRADLEKCIDRWKDSNLPVVHLPTPPPVTRAPVAPTATVLNRTVLNELREVLGSEVNRILSVYLQDTPRLIAQLEQAAVANNPIALRVAAHSLKSSSANVGASALSVAARDLEYGARDGTLTQPANAVAVIVAEFGRVRTALQAELNAETRR